MKNVVLLFSPGLDSYLSNYILSKRKDIELNRLYFDCCKYSGYELDFMDKRYDLGGNIFSEVIYNKCLQLQSIEMSDSYIPNRNIMFVTMATSIFKQSEEIYINIMKDDRCIDSNVPMFENYSNILSTSLGREIKIKSLFNNKEKADAIIDYLSMGGSKYNLLTHTYSCFGEYKERNTPVYSCLDTITGNKYKYTGSFFISGCLKCPACFRKMCALTAANIYVPFEDINLANEYKKIDKNIYPSRYKTINNYLDFINGKKDISI